MKNVGSTNKLGNYRVSYNYCHPLTSLSHSDSPITPTANLNLLVAAAAECATVPPHTITNHTPFTVSNYNTKNALFSSSYLLISFGFRIII